MLTISTGEYGRQGVHSRLSLKGEEKFRTPYLVAADKAARCKTRIAGQEHTQRLIEFNAPPGVSQQPPRPDITGNRSGDVRKASHA